MKLLKLICSLALLMSGLHLDIHAAQPEVTAVFDTPYRHTLPEDTRRIRKSDQTAWRDTVWKNDVLDAKIVIISEEDLTHCTVVTSDLRSEIGRAHV